MAAEDGGERRESLVLDETERGRLDVVLSEKLEGVSRAQAKRLIESGRVLVDGEAARPSRALKGTERIEVTVPAPAPATPGPEAIPLGIVYEDRSLIVVDKPPGMVVHPGAGHASGTLVNALLAHARDLSGIGGVLRPGIVHRLDAGTSGLIVVAKSDHAHQDLARQFAERRVLKRYRAVVHGHPPDHLVLEDPIGRDPKHRKRMSSRSTRPRPAKSELTCIERLPGSALVAVRIFTGRTHQIRVHVSEAGFPVVGDKDYGSPRRGAPRPLLRFGRTALHAAELELRHPDSGERLRFESPLPDDMAELVTALRRCAS